MDENFRAEIYNRYSSKLAERGYGEEATAQGKSIVGYLQVQALTAKRTYPVKGAKVTVFKESGNKNPMVFYVGTTDFSGMTGIIEVPALDKEVSETPSAIQPYKTYDIMVEAENYLTMVFHNVPVFHGIVSWQNADLVPTVASKAGETKIEVYE